MLHYSDYFSLHVCNSNMIRISIILLLLIMAKNVEDIISISKVREGINFYPALMDNLVYFIILLYLETVSNQWYTTCTISGTFNKISYYNN